MIPIDPREAILYALQYHPKGALAEVLDVTPRTVHNWSKGIGRIKRPQQALLQTYLEGGVSAGRNIFTFIDLFAGIGGIRRGFEACGGRCIWTSEWDKFAVHSYKTNFPDEHEIWSDITTADPKKDIPDHDVLLAGFPCQPFSLAGVSKKNSLGRAHGFLDKTQGTLFFDVARIIKAKQPKAFMLENVKNLISHDKGRTLETILRVLEDELDYKVHYKVINAASWVPQHRQRIYIVGFREKNVPFSWNVMPIPDAKPTLASILHSEDEEPEEPYTVTVRGKTKVADRYTLSDKLWAYLQAYAAKHAAKGNGFGCSLVGPDDISRTLSARYYKDGSEILIRQGSKMNPRMLTPRECARLMGFETKTGPKIQIPVSDTRAYKQFGNSVAVPVVTEVAKLMLRGITDDPIVLATLPNPSQLTLSLAS